VISGASFSDDSARDARRGLTWSGVDIGVLVKAMFPGAHLLVFKEEGELALVPDYAGAASELLSSDAVGYDALYSAWRCGGRGRAPARRWNHLVDEPDELARLVEGDLIDGALVLPAPAALEGPLAEALYLLVGHGESERYPIARFQPLALPQLLEHALGVICVHQDKHGPALGIYSRAPLERDRIIDALAESAGALSVPFSIPPMLARWDRALHEFRVNWMASRADEFPVPPAPVGLSPWSASAPRNRGAAEARAEAGAGAEAPPEGDAGASEE